MEVAVAIAVIASVPIVYSVLRPWKNTSVECWFCRTTTQVKYENRNSFMCPSCEQYNGFNEDGDYNRRIPEQSYTKLKRYCEPPRIQPEKTNGFVNRFSGFNMSSKAANGLCEECNLGQEIIMNKVREFEPVDEDRWNEELEDYRYKLERMHQLCPRCTIQVHGKLEEDKKKYSYLLEIKYKLKHVIGSTLREAISNAKKSKKTFFSGGSVCESLHLICIVSSILLFLANIEYLQQDADVTLISMPNVIRDQLPAAYNHSLAINFMIFSAHLIAAFNNKCRVTLPDLLLPLLLILGMLTYLAPDNNQSQDVALIRGACASFTAILSMAVALLPRKKLHKKRPNKIFSSAFSVASTPISQCSSQNSRNASLLEHENSVLKSPQNRSPSAFSSTRTLLGDITNSQTRLTAGNREDNVNRNQVESMDWDDSESNSPSYAQSVQTGSSHFKPGLLSTTRNWSMTPQRLTPSVASMNIHGTERQHLDSPSIFSRKHRQILQKHNETPARSLIGPSRSLLGSQVERNYHLHPEMHTRSGSEFTSVSQQDGYSTVSGAWQCRVIGILFALVFIVLLMQIALFYVLFTRN